MNKEEIDLFNRLNRIINAGKEYREDLINTEYTLDSGISFKYEEGLEVIKYIQSKYIYFNEQADKPALLNEDFANEEEILKAYGSIFLHCVLFEDKDITVDDMRDIIINVIFSNSNTLM